MSNAEAESVASAQLAGVEVNQTEDNTRHQAEAARHAYLQQAPIDRVASSGDATTLALF
ncbi:hypothetical protein [Cognatiyoonia sp.]|uniref:hypothetical protein n=1 Tax=Cognatiyoonia sp. TaxID=2211652 RepID=UPI003F6A4B26